MNKMLLLLVVCFQAACVSTTITPPKTIDVYKSDGARQCQGEGVSPQAMQSELDGVKVYTARKDYLRGMMYPSVCGGMTGSVNVYTIAIDMLKTAQQRGFEVFKTEEY